jgi:hypothetical protein
MANKINDTKLNYLFINNAKYNIVFLYKHYFFQQEKEILDILSKYYFAAGFPPGL